MEKTPLVSVVTPCHNSASYIHRLLDSLLSQTYPKIEMIAVDNDSKDNTASIILDYVPKFEAKGYSLTYIHEADLGPSTGVQNGIRHIKGEYLVMPDSDDWYAESTSIEKFVSKFNELSDDYAIIRSQLQFIDEKNMQPIGLAYENFPEDDPGTLFEDCLFAKNGYNFAPIDYMVKVSKFREMTGLEIFNAYNVGQQRQICLPLYYKYKAWTIAEPLVCYLVRKTSVSHGDYAKYSVKRQLYKLDPKYIDSILSTIDVMPESEKMKYRKAFLRMRAMDLLKIAVANGAKDDYCIYLNDYRANGGNSFFVYAKFCLLTVKGLIKRVIKKCKRKNDA